MSSTQNNLELTESLSEAMVVVWPNGGWQVSEAYMVAKQGGFVILDKQSSRRGVRVSCA